MLEFELEKGITVGDVSHKTCELREATGKDLAAAAKKAEHVVLAPTGRASSGGLPLMEPAILINPYLMELNVLFQQIERIGEIQGPLEPEHWELLSEADISLIKLYAEQLAEARLASTEVVQRGRTDGQHEAGQASD